MSSHVDGRPLMSRFCRGSVLTNTHRSGVGSSCIHVVGTVCTKVCLKFSDSVVMITGSTKLLSRGNKK